MGLTDGEIRAAVATQRERVSVAKREVVAEEAALNVIRARCPHRKIVGTMTMGDSGSKCGVCGEVFS